MKRSRGWSEPLRSGRVTWSLLRLSQRLILSVRIRDTRTCCVDLACLPERLVGAALCGRPPLRLSSHCYSRVKPFSVRSFFCLFKFERRGGVATECRPYKFRECTRRWCGG